MTEVSSVRRHEEIRDAIEAANELSREVPESALASTYPLILRALLGEHPGTSRPSGDGLGDSNGSSMEPNLLGRPVNEVVAAVRPGSQADSALLISAWIEAQGESVTVGGLNDAFRDARIPAVANMAAVVGRLLQLGRLSIVDQTGSHRVYAVTLGGTEHVRTMVESEEQ